MTNLMHPELEKLQNGNPNSAQPYTICKDMNNALPSKPLGERRVAVLRQELMVLLGNMGVLGAGMAVAMPAVTLDQLLNSTEESFHLNDEEASWFSSINTMACPLGGLLVSSLMDRIGRKQTILLTNVIGIVGWGLLAAAPLHSSHDLIFSQMLIARFISGTMIGLCLSPVGVYSAEISLPKIRGRLILCTSIAIAAGILFMYVLGYFIRNDWQLISMISCGYQVIALLCVFPMPESPSWLMHKGYIEKARKSLSYFRGLSGLSHLQCDEFEVELTLIKKTADQSRITAANESLFQAAKAPEVYKPLILMIGFFFLQQFSGVVVVVVFAVQIAVRAGVSTDPLLVAVFVGVARIITTFFMSSILERWGRRPAGIISASGMTACMALLALSGWYHEINDSVPLLPVFCIILHIIFSTMGLLTLPFFMISEVFPQRVRGSASGLTVCIGLLASFAVIKLYPTMEASMGTANVFAFYSLISLAGVFYIFYLIPETKGRTLLEIEEYFRTGRTTSFRDHHSEIIKEVDVEMKSVLVNK